jgi:PKD repeat protein
MTNLGASGSTTPGGFTAPQIGAAQGFMVDVSVATSLQFVGGMRGTGEPTNNPQFLDVNEFSTARVRIFNADESQSYETMLAFKDDATDEIDHQQDAVRFPVPLGLEVYTINGNNNFVIQALPTLHNGRIIPLGTQMGEANGSYKIRLTEFSNFESSTRVYIEDLATGAFHNLSQNNTYDFVNMPWTGQRFKLHFRAPIAMAASGACAGDASGKLILNNPNPTAATLTVKNAEGMTIAQESNWMGDKVINNLSTGNYNVAIAYDANDVINMNASIANGSLTAPAAFTASSTVVTLEDASIQFAGNNNGATTYSWNFGDGNTVNGVLNPVHTYSAAGQYTVTFTTSSNGCESTTTKVINVSNGTVGINDIANGNSFSIYPNPSADIAYVMLNMAANEKDVMVTILDGAGRVVSKERVNEVRNGSVVTLNVSEIANGIYEVVVENKNFRAVGKLSVTH